MAVLRQGITENGIGQGDLYAFLTNVVTIVNELKADVNLLRADMVLRISDHNTLRAKLNADAGVTDADYAAATAITATTIAASDLSLAQS